MVSEKTLKWTMWIIRMGCFIKAFPAVCDPQGYCVRPNHGEFRLFLFSNKYFSRSIRIKVGKIFQVIYILLYVPIISFFSCFLIFFEHNTMDLYLSIMVILLTSMILVAQINFYYFSDDIFRAFNSILVLDKKLRKYFSTAVKSVIKLNGFTD